MRLCSSASPRGCVDALLVFPAILIGWRPCFAGLSETPRGHEFRRDPFYQASDANSVFKPHEPLITTRAIETIKREKLAGYEVLRGVGGEGFRAGRAGCEQDQNRHRQ